MVATMKDLRVGDYAQLCAGERSSVRRFRAAAAAVVAHFKLGMYRDRRQDVAPEIERN